METLTQDRVMAMLEATSRTFFIPISRMPPGLKEATTSAYLCMRAIDEIEDHPGLSNAAKARILQQISLAFQSHPYRNDANIDGALAGVFEPYRLILPEVSQHLAVWANHAPASIAPRIWADTAAMADRMAYWATINWRIDNLADLEAYTYSVAAAVGLLVCDLSAWHDGTQLDRAHAIHFGRALQATNIIRNHAEDIARGVDFYPRGWTDVEMFGYARGLLDVTARYAETLPMVPCATFIRIPLALAQATLNALEGGQVKLTRQEVMHIVGTG